MAYTWTNGEVITAEKLNQTGGGAFIVNITEENSELVADKTYAEIYAAYTSGQIPVAVFDDAIYHAQLIDEGGANFAGLVHGGGGGAPVILIYTSISIYGNNQIVMDQGRIQLT